MHVAPNCRENSVMYTINVVFVFEQKTVECIVVYIVQCSFVQDTVVYSTRILTYMTCSLY